MRKNTITIQLPNGQLHAMSRRVYDYHIARVTGLMTPTALVVAVRSALLQIGQEWRGKGAA